jgi:hypothetical protein
MSWIEFRAIMIVALCVLSAVIVPVLVLSCIRRSFWSLICLGVLAMLGPAAAWASADDDDSPPILGDTEFAPLLNGVPESVRTDVVDSPAVTDKGRSLRLQTAPGVHFNLDEFNQMQVDLLARLEMTGTVTPLPLGWQNANCHGWVFTGGTFFVINEDVQTILDDNGYKAVGSPHASDIAVYRNSEGQVIHTALVRFTGLGSVMVESKWGHCGVFLHPSDVHPYRPAECAFYRSSRSGHLLAGLPERPRGP